VAVQNGMVMVSYINKLRNLGMDLREAGSYRRKRTPTGRIIKRTDRKHKSDTVHLFLWNWS
jgi:hypothetical protein